MDSRIITIFSAKGNTDATVTTDATTWGQLKPLIKAQGFELHNLAATESVGRTDLAHEQAVLPEGPFTVFLRPTKTKSGGVDWSEATYNELKAEISRVGDSLKEYLNGKTEGNTWTRMSKIDMRKHIAAFHNQASGVAPAKVAKATPSKAVSAGPVRSASKPLSPTAASTAKDIVESGDIVAALNAIEILLLAVAKDANPARKELIEGFIDSKLTKLHSKWNKCVDGAKSTAQLRKEMEDLLSGF